MTPNRESVVLTGRLFPDGNPARIEVREGRITTVAPVNSLDESPDSERWIVPGFFDVQVNGFAGRSFAEPGLTVEDVEFIARAQLSTGTTRLLPTLVTAHLDALCHQLSVLADAMERIPLVRAMCPGIHLEGPFIHPEDGPRGAHRRECVRDASIPEYDRLQAAARGKILMLTLAPERPGAIDLIRHAAGKGVVVALGHHRADDATLDRAIAAGARTATHLGNGSDAMLPRLSNHIWRQLGDDRLWASFIADGHHLPPATLRSMLRAKGMSRSLLVTDAIELAGMPPGRYPRRGTEAELTPDGKVVLVGTPYLAGSAATMPQLLTRAITDAGLNFTDAVRLATLQPEKLMQPHVAPWSCEPGQPPNLVELTRNRADAGIKIKTAVIERFISSQ